MYPLSFKNFPLGGYTLFFSLWKLHTFYFTLPTTNFILTFYLGNKTKEGNYGKGEFTKEVEFIGLDMLALTSTIQKLYKFGELKSKKLKPARGFEPLTC